MDFRSTRAFDYVSASTNLTKNAEKIKATQIQWLHDYWWLCDKYRELDKKLSALCKEKVQRDTSGPTPDPRTCLPFPKTSNDNYGWLASKRDFQLEIYGKDTTTYPDPMDDICLLGGAVPTLAAGKGFL
ncbi:uncharacterized protein LOC131669606 [Phymastichus coffea]|uniref:uncharacterized protein LOC131669606 n=1 Tax=Phymastichus coffea TaxID=108790 RepID=UPI00273B93F5|nr:uncharacterized protein LOC131669606 [Phymastichus coffea]